MSDATKIPLGPLTLEQSMQMLEAMLTNAKILSRFNPYDAEKAVVAARAECWRGMQEWIEQSGESAVVTLDDMRRLEAFAHGTLVKMNERLAEQAVAEHTESTTRDADDDGN